MQCTFLLDAYHIFPVLHVRHATPQSPIIQSILGTPEASCRRNDDQVTLAESVTQSFILSYVSVLVDRNHSVSLLVLLLLKCSRCVVESVKGVNGASPLYKPLLTKAVSMSCSFKCQRASKAGS